MRKIGRNIERQEKNSKSIVYIVIAQKALESVEMVSSYCDGRELFKIPKKRVGEKKDVVWVSSLKVERRVVKVSVDDQKKTWKEHMEKLMNVENEWSDSIDASTVEGTVKGIEVEEVRCAMNRMKIGTVSGPSGVAIKLFKAGGNKSFESLTNIFNDILFKDMLSREWMLSLLVKIFKEEGDPLNSNCYRE